MKKAPVLPAMFKGCFGATVDERTTLQYLAQTREALFAENVWTKAEYTHETHGQELVERTLRRYPWLGNRDASTTAANHATATASHPATGATH